ncbi:EB1-like domain-containing protein [Colletotrichum cuscutae]|uniref:EB1-like domain-containing protein n=1 Tax=Colletotrichum cuscutae TaxID=1209917 RepID=A0AAI9TYG9_9PEZI|nr:EB1-like domain-containing protein [Colletotrichum cuscutae]
MVDWATILLATILAAFTPGADKATRFNFCPVALQLVIFGPNQSRHLTTFHTSPSRLLRPPTPTTTNRVSASLERSYEFPFDIHPERVFPIVNIVPAAEANTHIQNGRIQVGKASIPFHRGATPGSTLDVCASQLLADTAWISRQELIQWLNQLLSLNITKVEQCGTGAALCQVFDSIFMDIPMSRVKFNVNSEYAYIQNFKVLQNCFHKHQVDKPIPVEALVKCKMQDNLEFLQWTKKFWDLNFPDHEYDAVSRRKGAPVPSGGGPAPRAASGTGAAAARRGGTTPLGGARVPKAAGPGTAALQQENATLKETVVGLERERDFYFSKLRDIELLVQQAVEEDPELEKQEDGLVKQIQTILYSTEEGFEIPAEGEAVDDQETF